MSYFEVMALPANIFLELIEAMQILYAEETLMQMSVASYPSLTKNSKENMHRKIHKQSRPGFYKDDAEVVSMTDFGKILSGLNGR